MLPYCISGYEIYRRVNPRADFEHALGNGAQAFGDLHKSHYEVDTELSRIVKSLGDAWKGEAAEAAKAEMMELQKVSATVAKANMEPAQYSYDDESSSHASLRNGLHPVDAEPEEAGWYGVLPGFDSQEDKNAQWQADNQHNINEYDKFYSRSQQNQRLMNEPFPEIKIGDDVNSGDKGRTGGVAGGGGATSPSSSGSGSAPTAASGYGGGAYGGGSYSTSAPQVQSPAGAGGYYGGTSPAGSGGSVTGPSATGPSTGLPPGAERLPDGSIRYPDGTIRYPDGTVRTPDGRLIRPGSTTTSGLGTGRPRSGADGGYGPGGAAGPGLAGGAVAGGGAAAGSASGMAGQPLGGGKAAGAMPSQGAAPGGMAAKGGAGFGPGRGGMGGMMGGAGAGRGQGGDDDGEHQDKYYIKQEMDPGLHVEYDEHGEKLVDESTGFTVVPPVIGE
ncbi:hypothetical protein [Haloechinothrix salitolerans]|uniref:PPE family protein n=1 Tax=Haloechinothrix salitolerans TaxID=926830 RepID=A0ABW2BTN6_9PSEU